MYITVYSVSTGTIARVSYNNEFQNNYELLESSGMIGICATKESDSQSVGSRAIMAILEMIVLMASLVILQKRHNIVLIVRTSCQLLG
jgi:sugar phosphate permease